MKTSEPWLTITLITIGALVVIYLYTRWKYDLKAELNLFKETMFDKIQQQHSQHVQQVQTQNDHVLHHFKTGLQQQLEQNTQHLHQSMGQFQKTFHQHLDTGLKQTQGTFHSITQRLTVIDEAQKKMFDLSSQVNQLQNILTNKQNRGYLGEVQLIQIIEDALPKAYYQIQHTLSNQKRVDCLIKLPEPTGAIAIDAKFPLESYQQMIRQQNHPSEKKNTVGQFRQNIKTHIKAIAEKYIVPKETAHYAIMFIPSEAVFSEICANHPSLVQFASQEKVWLASPTTMMAILNTTQIAIKDHLQNQQIHVIQKHMLTLGQDFNRLHKRLSDLATHIGKAHEDIENVQISAHKIIRHFHKIEQVDMNKDLVSQKEKVDQVG